MKKKIIKLINNERSNKKITSVKGCDATSNDYCYELDLGVCTVYAYDDCSKDYDGCSNGGHDLCVLDFASDCTGAGIIDKCEHDLPN